MQWHYLILALRTIMQSDLCSRGQEAMHNFQAFLKSRLCFEIKLTTSFGMRQRPRTGISKLFHQEKRGKNIISTYPLFNLIWFNQSGLISGIGGISNSNVWCLLLCEAYVKSANLSKIIFKTMGGTQTSDIISMAYLLLPEMETYGGQSIGSK